MLFKMVMLCILDLMYNNLENIEYDAEKYQKYIDSALAILPKDPFLLQQKAIPFFKMKKYELGIKYLDKAVENDNQYDKYSAYRAFIKCIFQKIMTAL